MEATPAASRLLEFLISLLSIGLPGLPPGDRDPNLWHAVPPDAVVAYEWSGQGRGALGSTGIDGFAADPEVQALWSAIREAAVEQDHQAGPPQTIYEISGRKVARVLLSRPGCLYVALAPPKSGLPPLQRLRVAVVLNGGNQPDAILKQLSELLPDWMLRDTRANPSQQALVTGLVQHRRVGPYLAWGFNAGAADEALARLTSRQGGLAVTPEFARRFAVSAVERPSSMFWLQGSAALDALTDFLPAAAALKSKLPVNILGGCMVVTGLEQGRVIARGSVSRAPGPAIIIKPEVLQYVPADAHFVLSGPLQLDGTLLQNLAGLAPDGPKALEQLRDALIGATREDFGPTVFAAFGSNWTIYSAPSTGGPFGIGPVLAVELHQPLLVATEFPKVMSRWQQQLQNGRSEDVLNVTTVQGYGVYSLQTPGFAAQGIAPSWCVTDRHLLLSVQPQPLRAHLRFLESKEPRFIERIGGDVSFPDRTTAWGFIDSPALTRVIWPILPYVAGKLDPQLNVAAIPSTAAILPHLGVTTFVARADAESWQFECRNPLSLAAPMIAAATIYEAAHAPQLAKPNAASATSIGVSLGAPEGAGANLDKGVKPAVAIEEKPLPSPPRRNLSGLLRAFTPDDLQSLIPPEVFRRLDEGPTPEQLQQRQERQKQRDLKRAQRKGLAP